MAVDVTALAIGVTVALAVGILILLVVFAAYLKSRRRVDKLRELITTSGAVQRGTSTSRARLSDNITDVLQDRRHAAASGLTKRMTGYPGRMYMPGESFEMEERHRSYGDDEGNMSPNNYERRIVPARRYELEESSSDSSSEDDTRHRRRRHHKHASRCPVPTMVVMPAPATTAAVVHPPPLVIQPQQPATFSPTPAQPSVFVPASTTPATTNVLIHVHPSPAAIQPPQPTPSQPSALVPASTESYALRDRGGATVFTAMRGSAAGQGRAEYEEQEKEAVAIGGASGAVPPLRPAVETRLLTHGMCSTAGAVVGRTDHGRSTRQDPVVVEARAVYEQRYGAAVARPSTEGMSTTAVAMVRGTGHRRSAT